MNEKLNKCLSRTGVKFARLDVLFSQTQTSNYYSHNYDKYSQIHQRTDHKRDETENSILNAIKFL